MKIAPERVLWRPPCFSTYCGSPGTRPLPEAVRRSDLAGWEYGYCASYFGAGFEATRANAGLTPLRPARKGEPERAGARFFASLRQTIESIFDTYRPTRYRPGADPVRGRVPEENARKTRELSESSRLDNPLNLSAWLPEMPYRSSPNYLREMETAHLQQVYTKLGISSRRQLMTGQHGKGHWSLALHELPAGGPPRWGDGQRVVVLACDGPSRPRR